MLFNSAIYLLFLPLVAVLYYALPLWWRRVMLVIASYGFYMVWSVPFSSLLVFSTIIDYTAARAIDGSKSPVKQRIALLVSLIANLGSWRCSNTPISLRTHPIHCSELALGQS